MPKVKAGVKLEQVIADWYAEETGKKVIKDNKIRIHRDYPFLIANIDRLITASGDDETGILECKASSRWVWESGDTEIPLPYYAQLQHYLSVTGYRWGEIAVLLDGYDFRHYYFERDEEFIDAMTGKLVDFWTNHIEKNIPPEPMNEKDIITLYPKSEKGKSIEADLTMLEVITEISYLKEKIAELKRLLDEKAEMVKLAMKDSELVTFGGKKLVSWKTISSRRLDSKKLKKEHPEIYDKYTATIQTRRFTIHGGKK